VSGDGSLPDDLTRWIERETGARVTSARRHLVGASRQAWSVDADRDDATLALFVLRDLGRGGGSRRDAAVRRALAPTAGPVPAVPAHARELGTLEVR
jgi:hypothetical protein